MPSRKHESLITIYDYRSFSATTMEKQGKLDKNLDKTISQAFKAKAASKPSPGPSSVSRRLLSVKSLILSVNAIIVLICTGICLVQSGQCLSRFLGYDTKAILSVLPTGDATFLALTICPTPEDAYNATLLKQMGISADDYKEGYFFGNNTAYSNATNGFEIFDRVSFKLSDIMDYIKISTADTNNASISIYFNQPLNEAVATWSTVYDIDYGKCYSMRIASEVTEKAIINLVLVTKMGILLYLHHPGQYWDVDSNTKTYGTIGDMLFIDLTHELTVNTLENNGLNSCNSTLDYSYDDCIMRGISKDLMAEFGCVVPFLPAYNGTQVCRFNALTQDGQALQKKLVDRYNFLSSSGQNTMCPAPCSSIDIFLGLPFGGVYQNEAYIKLYIKSTVKMKKTVWDYTWVSMLAEIGGYTGLLLGISVVNITDSLDWIKFRFLKV